MEQITGKFVPDVIALDTFKRLGLRNRELEKQLPKMIQKGLTMLYEKQSENGGWGWWGGEQADVYMTAYVTQSLALAGSRGVKVDKDRMQSALKMLWLTLNPSEANPLDSNTRAFVVYTLAYSHSVGWDKPDNVIPWDTVLDKLVNPEKPLAPISQAMLALTLHHLGRKDQATAALARLEAFAITEGGVHWQGLWSHDLHESDVEATAYALRALLAIEPTNPKIIPAIQWLSRRRSGYSWISTKSTSAAIYALADYLERSNELNPDYTLRVKVDGKVALERHITKEDVANPEIVIRLRPNSDSEVVLEKEGSGKAYYTVTRHSVIAQESIKPLGRGMEVTREYLIRQANGKWIPIRGSIPRGSIVAVHLTVSAREDLEYVMVEDPIPSGFEIVSSEVAGNELVGDYWEQVDERDDRVALFTSNMSKGKRTFHYTIRPEFDGVWHALPTRAQIMYQPDRHGRSASESLSVSR